MARLLLTTSLCCSVGIVASIGQAKAAATVSPTEQTFSFSIPAQSLDGALATFSKITHVQTVAAGELTRNVRSPGISGTLTPTAAMNVLLGGTGLSPRTSGNVIIVQKAAANITLGPVRVGGIIAQKETSTGPGVGYVAHYTEAGTKTDTPITQIPNSIYVITKQQILDQQAQNIMETLRYMPGVFADAGGTNTDGSLSGGAAANGTTSAIKMRGFAATQYIDGIMSNSMAAGETAFVERVEAINGPASVLYGQAGAGGLIATRLKQPLSTPIRNISVGFGNWGRYEATLDFGDKITKSGNLAYRIAAMGVTQNTQTDYVGYQRIGVLPSIKWDIDHKTSLTLLGEYMYTPQNGLATGYPGIGTLTRGKYGYLPTSRYLGDPSANKNGSREADFEYQFSHEFNRNWKFQQTFRYEQSTLNYNNLYLSGGLKSDSTIARNAWMAKGSNITTGVDSRIIGHLYTGSVKQTLVAGIDFRRVQIRQDLTYDTGDSSISSINVWDPVYYTSYPNYSMFNTSGHVSRSDAHDTQFQKGIYFQDQIQWKGLSILLGGRQDWYNYTFHQFNQNSTTNQTGSWGQLRNPSSAKFTWRGGFTYNFNFGLTPYFSYATSFIPQVQNFTYDGNPVKPLTGKQFEAGLKYLVPHTDVLLTAAAYHIKENHYLITDSEHAGYTMDAGTVVSKGVELSAHANVTHDLHLTASYSYNDTRVSNSDTSVVSYSMTGATLGKVSEQGKYISALPRNMVNMFIDYTIPTTIFRGVGINFGARYIGSTYANNANSYKVPSYVLFDTGIHYDFVNVSPALKGLRAQLAMSNIANTRYVTSCAASGTGGTCYYGQARRVYGNFSYSW